MLTSPAVRPTYLPSLLSIQLFWYTWQPCCFICLTDICWAPNYYLSSFIPFPPFCCIPVIMINSFFFFLTFQCFNWSMIALQCCVAFCCATVWISHKYTYLLPLESPLHPHPSPLGHHRALSWAPCAAQQLLASDPFHMCQCYSEFVPPSPYPPCVHRSVLCICVSISALQIGYNVSMTQFLTSERYTNH